jgi:spermidine synthase
MRNYTVKIALTAIICLFVIGNNTSVFGFYSDFGEVVHRKNSQYTSIFVYKSGSIATLRFGLRQNYAVESQVDLEQSHKHMLEYTEMMFSGLMYNSDPNRMLVLGLGGGVIPREMRHYYPNMEIDIAEIDKEIPVIAKEYFGFKDDEKMKVNVLDGRMFVKRQLRKNPVPKYDLIILDAFNSEYIPFHLMTKEFLEELKGLLSDDGVIVANVFYSNRLFEAEFKTFIDVFGKSQAYFGNQSTNAMIVTPGENVELLTSEQAVEKATELQEKLKLSFDFVRVAKLLAPERKPNARAEVLTDDRAPVNYLRNQEIDE